MNKRAIVHIGIEKTGTTAIQEALFSARTRLLSEARVLYPSIAANQSIHLSTMFRDEAPPVLQRIEPGTTGENSVDRIREKFRTSLKKDLYRPDWDILVISAESLCDFYQEAVVRLIDWLSSYVSDISIVAYVRHPVDWTRSVMQERLKQGETLGWLHENAPPGLETTVHSLDRSRWLRAISSGFLR